MSPILASISENWQLLGLIILSAAIPGGAGGLVAHFINNERYAEKPGRKDKAPPYQSGKTDASPSATELHPRDLQHYEFKSKWQSAFIGTCGAISFIFFVAAIGGINSFNTSLEIARFVSLSMIAGFGARRLLPMMVGHLEKQIAQAAETSQRALISAQQTSEHLTVAEHRITHTERKLELVRINANLLTAAHASASTSMRDQARQEAENALAGIEDTKNLDAPIPSIYINLARVYRASGDLSRAIDLLTKFVRKVERNELLRDSNFSIAYFNRACYQALRSEAGASAEELDRAMDDFERSIELSPDQIDDLRYALNDPDLRSLKQMKRFQDLLKRFNIAQPDNPAG